MGVQLSVDVRNARLDAIETEAGASAKLAIFTGSQPATCATANSGTKIAQFDLASDWAAAASGGSKSFSNAPLETVGIGGGNSCRTDGSGEYGGRSVCCRIADAVAYDMQRIGFCSSTAAARSRRSDDLKEIKCHRSS